MNRYLTELSYKGTHYSGWQSQPNARTIQECIESALRKILNSEINIVGCGRTDAGVHALQSFFHFDLAMPLDIDPTELCYRLNKNLDPDIAIHTITKVSSDFHARFDAISRSYIYLLSPKKLPFRKNAYWRYNLGKLPELSALNEAVSILLDYNEFYTFSKSNTDVKTYKCELSKARWTLDGEIYRLDVTSNRFLRGMIRLIVGMSINYGRGAITEKEIRTALINQQRLVRSYSAPPEGLYLSKIVY